MNFIYTYDNLQKIVNELNKSLKIKKPIHIIYEDELALKIDKKHLENTRAL